MPSTRKQNARQKRSRQSDEMCDIENVDIMLGNYPGNGLESQLDEDFESDELQQNINLTKEDLDLS